jgi:hypothetical protein
MGDAGEGLIDADARIQERMDELEQERKNRNRAVLIGDPEEARRLESLRLARTATERRLAETTNEALKRQLQAALTDLDRQLAASEKPATAARK